MTFVWLLVWHGSRPGGKEVGRGGGGGGGIYDTKVIKNRYMFVLYFSLLFRTSLLLLLFVHSDNLLLIQPPQFIINTIYSCHDDVVPQLLF